MKSWFDLPENKQIEIFEQVGMKEGLPSSAIEKDWWVSLTLNLVFSLPFSNALLFKGGTSLSKGWNLIERFSEDIDLAVDMEYLGFSGDISRTQVNKLRKVSCKFIKEDFFVRLLERAKEYGIRFDNIFIPDTADSDKDPLTIEIQYKSLTEKSYYILPKVLIEIGARSLKEPYKVVSVQSLAGKDFNDSKYFDKPIEIPTVLPKRTFLEKVFLLHEEFQKPKDKIRVDRLSRHLYDLEKMMDTEHGVEALNDVVLYKTIVLHRERFNFIKGLNYKNHQPDKIDFVPPAFVIKEWEEDYKIMQENMIYGESLSFKSLIERMKELQYRFRKIMQN